MLYQRQTEIVQGIGKFGPDLKSPGVTFAGLFPSLQTSVTNAEIIMCLWVVWHGRYSLATCLKRVFSSVKMKQTHGHGVEGDAIIRCKLKAFFNKLKRFIELRLRHHPVCKIGSGLNVVRFEMNGAHECLYCVFLMSNVCCGHPKKV